MKLLSNIFYYSALSVGFAQYATTLEYSLPNLIPPTKLKHRERTTTFFKSQQQILYNLQVANQI